MQGSDVNRTGCSSFGLHCPALGLAYARLCRLCPCPSFLDSGRGLWTELNIVANKEEFLVSVRQRKLVLTCFPYFPALKQDVSPLFYELLAYWQLDKAMRGCTPSTTTAWVIRQGRGPAVPAHMLPLSLKWCWEEKKVFKRGNWSEQKFFHLKFINQ